MTLQHRITAGVTLGGLGFLTSLSASLVVSTNESTSLIVIGIIMLLCALGGFLIARQTSDDPKRRWTTFWTSIFAVPGGVVLFHENDEWREITHVLTIAVFFSLTAISVSTLISNLYHPIVHLAMPDLLSDAEVTQSEEQLVYFVINMLSGLLIGILVGISDPENKIPYMDRTGITNSIGIWFLNGILCALIGVRWARKTHAIAGQYISSTTPLTPERSPYTQELSEMS
jgi:uncharacterized membrane protein HdeD (DUF308 family)